MRMLSVALLASAGLAVTPGLAAASGVAYPDGDWTQASIPSTDGVVLHADVLRPKAQYLPADGKTPVIVSIGPYFNHSGQTGPAGPAESSLYDPVGPNDGPSERFADFVEGSGLLKKGYTFVMVDLRGFGGSTGCSDWGGPGEQADVASAIKWAGTQSWSTGAVGTYGKSYDAMTGLIATTIKDPDALQYLKGVVAQEPVYDDYRYLYGDGIRRENALATPALYDAIETTPGPATDDPGYNAGTEQENASRPGCQGASWLDQAGNPDHYSDYWRARDLIAKEQGSEVPLFLTQGLTENNTAPDGTTEFLQARAGDAPTRAWLGPWQHVRGNEVCGDPDGGLVVAGDNYGVVGGTSGCTTATRGKLKMGRAGFFSEVLSFYDEHLKGIAPTTAYPPVAVQTNDGKWRPELQWPPADATGVTSPLNAGSYTDDANGTRTSTDGVWTFSPPLTDAAQLSGAGTVTVDTSVTAPGANLVADVYDVPPTNKAILIARQGRVVNQSGKYTLRLMSADWKIPAGHRIAVRIVSNNNDWWIAAIPTNQTVKVYGGSVTLPFLTYQRPQLAQGGKGISLDYWNGQVATLTAAAVTAGTRQDFTLPPAQQPQPAAMQAALDQYIGR